MLRRGEKLCRRVGLDDLALCMTQTLSAMAPHDAEVMRDEQHRHAELRPGAPSRASGSAPARDVERRRRLVRDEQVGIVGQRHGDHHALPLPARELVREVLQPGFGSRMPTFVRSSMMRSRAFSPLMFW